MALQHESQDALEFIGTTIAELESELEYKKVEAERRGWYPNGKKYQAITEMDRHKGSLKRLRTIIIGKDGSQDALEYIGATITELQSYLEYKKDEAERKGWSPDGKKYQAITEMDRHIWSLKRLRTILIGKDEFVD